MLQILKIFFLHKSAFGNDLEILSVFEDVASHYPHHKMSAKFQKIEKKVLREI